MKTPLTLDEAEERYINALACNDHLRQAYQLADRLPQTRKRIKATMKSVLGAVNNARRFYEAAVQNKFHT